MTHHRSIVLRTAFVAALGAAMLAGPGTAFAQSQQGGYLGVEPGAHQTAALTAPLNPASHPSSGQGGYLGINAGAKLVPETPDTSDMKSSPTAWCRMSPGDRDICMKNAAVDHAQCMAEDPNHYAACRFAFDRMHFK